MTSAHDPKVDERQRVMAEADAKMVSAKQRFSAAALACLRNTPNATALVRDALGEVDAARERLRGLSDVQLDGDASRYKAGPTRAHVTRQRAAQGRPGGRR